MIKKIKGISVNVVSVFVILTCLLLSCVGATNSWFTSSHERGVEIFVSVGDLKIMVYQTIANNDVKIFTDQDNQTESSPQYVVLESVVAPDEDVDLILKVANEDPGSTSMYLRFKFELYIRGVESDTLLPCEINEFDMPTSTSNGFTYKQGYYYYTDINGNNVQLARGTSAVLMESFNVSYGNFVNADGSFKYVNSETLYVKLTIDASAVDTFN